MNKLNYRISSRRILMMLAMMLCLLPWHEAVAAFKLVPEATITVVSGTAPDVVSASLKVKPKTGSNIFFDDTQNMIIVRGNGKLDLSLTYSAIPSKFIDPRSKADLKGIYTKKRPFSQVGDTPVNIGADTATWTNNKGEFLIFGQVHYTLCETGKSYTNEVDVTPTLLIFQGTVLASVQTKFSDGNPVPVTYGKTLESLLPLGVETADLNFKITVTTLDKTHSGNPVPATSVAARVLLAASGLDLATTPWVNTDMAGEASVKIGGGKETVPITGWKFSSQMFISIAPPNDGIHAPGYFEKALTLENMDIFKGTLNLEVTDPAGHPMPKPYINCWGGLSQYVVASGRGDAQGRFSVNFGGPDTKNLTVALNPKVTMTQYQTQVIDFPVGWVDTIPAYLSPQIDLAKEATTYKTDQEGSTQLILRIKDAHGAVIQEISDHTVKHPDALTSIEFQKGKNRIFYPYKPPLNSDSYKIEAVYKNDETEADEDEQVVGSALFPVLKTRVPALDRPFNFQFVAVSASAPPHSALTSLLTSRISSGEIAKQMKWVQTVFPASIKYSLGADQIASSWYMDSGRVKYYFKYLTQYKPRDVDLVIGIVAPGDLNTFLGGTAAGLSDPNYPFVVLIDPSRIPAQGVLHEFLHTRGLPDNLGGTLPPPAEDGYNSDTLTPMINATASQSYPQVQAVMFDAANDPWLSQLEYTRLLQYATVPIARKLGLEKDTGAPCQAAAPQKVMIVSANFRWTGAPYTWGLTLVSNEPVFTDWDDPYAPKPAARWDYPMPGAHLGNAGATITQYAWVTPLDSALVPKGVNFDPREAGSFTFKFPFRDEYTVLSYGAFNWQEQFVLAKSTLTFSANAPTATWLGPPAGTQLKGKTLLSFSVADKDAGGKLYAWVKVSTDGGQNWRAAAPYYELPAGTSTFTLDCDQFPTTTQCKIKVLVSDGLRSTILEPATVYTLTGYTGASKILAEPVGYNVTVKTPASFTIPLRITNQGFDPLSVDIDPASLPAWLDKTMSRLTGQVVATDAEFFPLLGKLSTAGKYTATLKIRTNDPKTPILDYPITITVGTTAPVPQVAFVQCDLSAPSGGTLRPTGVVTISAWEMAGGTGLDARIRIEQTLPGAAVMVDDAAMSPGPTPGRYTYDWTPPTAAAGKSYATEVTMTNTATTRKDVNGSHSAGWDVVFKIAGTPNRQPVFTLPTTTTTILNATNGKEVVLNYVVSDPDGDPLSLNLNKNITFTAANNTQVKMDTQARQIRFTPVSDGAYGLTLCAMDPSGAIGCRQWMVNVATQAVKGHALPGNVDYTMLTGATQWLQAWIDSGGGDKGCRFDWRLQGATTWNKSALVAWHTYPFDTRRQNAELTWNVSTLAAGSTYEVRFIDVNAQGQDDPNPTILHFIKAANGGKVTKIEAPSKVGVGLPFTFRVHVLNTSTDTWTQVGGYKLTSGATADPFTRSTSLELGPAEMVPPGATAIYYAWATAPATAGSYVTKWQPYTAALTAYGTAGQATVQVVSVPAVDTGELRDYLLGKWVPSTAWLTAADLDKNGKITIADLQQLANLLRSIK